MKKLGLLIVALIAVVLTGCDPQCCPETTVKAYYKALQEQDFTTSASYILMQPGDSQKEMAEALKTVYSKDGAIVSFDVFGSAKTTNDVAEVAVATEIAKAPKGYDPKGVSTLNLVKSNGKWYIKF